MRSIRVISGAIDNAALRRAAIACALFATAASAQRGAPASSPLYGALAPGRHAVGFRKIELRDPTRYDLPKVDAQGRRATTAERARRITVHLWYPAEATSSQAMTLADYMFSHFADTASEASRRADEGVRRRFFDQFGGASDTAWQRLNAAPLLGRRNAVAASGRFPLIVGQLRRFSTTVTNEFLASHGYVVAMSDGFQPDTNDAGAALEVAVRDMELMVAELRKLPNVHQTGLAALGFSGSGFSQILFAMRHPDVDAVCDLESAIFDDGVLWPLSRGWGYSLTAMRPAFLHTYSVPLAKRENRFADFEGMRYSNRYHYLVDAPGIHHWISRWRGWRRARCSAAAARMARGSRRRSRPRTATCSRSSMRT